MNAARRARQKANRRLGGRTTVRVRITGSGMLRKRFTRVYERQVHPVHVQRVNPDHPPVMHVHDDGRVHRSGSPLPVSCSVCRPLPRLKRWDRSMAGKAVPQ